MFSRDNSDTHRTLQLTREYDEARIIVMSTTEQGDLVITEQSDGELTMLAHGTLTHTSRVTIPVAHIDHALHAIGCSHTDAATSLHTFFMPLDVHLSDLQDKLDVAGIGYAFAAWDDGGIAYRAVDT